MDCATSAEFMDLGGFVVRNTFRNKRRSLTMISISRAFHIDRVAPEAARRLILRDRVSLAFFLPAYDRDKIRPVPGAQPDRVKGSAR
jgi:hypothetical protein